MLRMLKISSQSVTLNKKLAFDTNEIKRYKTKWRNNADDVDDDNMMRRSMRVTRMKMC